MNIINKNKKKSNSKKQNLKKSYLFLKISKFKWKINSNKMCNKYYQKMKKTKNGSVKKE